MDPILGTIIIFAGTYAPQGWFDCDGRSLSINQYAALYSILGTTYGGDGQATFALPDLRGRTPMGINNEKNSTPFCQLGQKGGSEIVKQTAIKVSSNATTGDVSVIKESPQSNMQPYLGVRYIICVEGGVYPMRP